MVDTLDGLTEREEPNQRIMTNQGNHLPTVNEINTSSEVLSQPDGAAKVVKVYERFAVKFGKGVSLIEAENMAFISSHTGISMPKVFAAFTEPETNMTYIIMEFVQGATLETLLPTLSAREKSDICRHVRDALNEIRQLPSPDYFGGIGRRPYSDTVFWTSDNRPAISGPFADQAEMNQGLMERLRQSESAPYVQFMGEIIGQVLHGHRAVLTHGDVQPKNIIVNRTGTREDGSGTFEISLIDWELAGWYPEYWEFCSSTIACRWKPGWLELVLGILHAYRTEYLLMQAIYSTVYY